MAALIVYAPEGSDKRYQVWFGDGLMPGREFASLPNVDEANEVCIRLAWSMRVRAMPLDQSTDWRCRITDKSGRQV